ncbi:chitinase domain-containing protein 1 [Lucilia sericata]|uniref:chitinase domain-containing protein 1 n=1 Tax=Lucilia sericata TaxID=13632 RepID=UPI0018A85B5D|nr:chitinase domain-containing protein 1 [Lucilia sericata]
MLTKERKILTLKLIIFTCLLVGKVDATISPGDKSQKQPKPLKVKTGPRDESVFDLDLIDIEPSAKEILINSGSYYKDTTARRFNGTVLGFVTPWNSHGYEIATTFAKKFDLISPVWFQIVKQDGKYKVNGLHDIDARWMKDVRTKGKNEQRSMQFFPRFLFENFSDNDFTLLLSSDQEIAKVSELLRKTCVQHKFEGIVLEYWLQLGGRVANKFLQKLAISISKALAKDNLKLILVIPPYRPQLVNMFNDYHMDKLYQHVYAFSLMTYDYSTVQRPGANSPLHWIKQSIEHIAPDNTNDVMEKRKKILMGLNMYGNDYTPDGGGPIVAGQYLDLLRNLKKRLTYDENDVENFFEIRTNTGRHYVFYPTLYSLNERIKLAQKMGVGISIWELGQGLDYFYDLF